MKTIKVNNRHSRKGKANFICVSKQRDTCNVRVPLAQSTKAEQRSVF
jgi:hypothetical protein